MAGCRYINDPISEPSLTELVPWVNLNSPLPVTPPADAMRSFSEKEPLPPVVNARPSLSCLILQSKSSEAAVEKSINPPVLLINSIDPVDVNDTLAVDGFKFDSQSEIYTSVDTDLSSVSSNHDTLVSAKAVKTSLDALDTTLTIGADSGSNDNVTVGTDTLNFAGTTNEIETTVTNNQIQIGLPNNITVSGNLTVNGNTDLGNATSDTITVTGRFDSSLAPSADDTHDLGTTTRQWRNIYIDGIAFIDDIHADDCDINGGTIDGITSLTSRGDLDIGSHNFRAATLQSDTLGTAGVVHALSSFANLLLLISN